MKNPIIKIRNTWRIIIDASSHYSRNLAYFFLFSILPMGLLYSGTIYIVEYTGKFTILFISVPLFLFIYGITLLISWETMWGATPRLWAMVKYLTQVIVKFPITILLFWTALVILPILAIIFIYKIFQFYAESKSTGILTSFVLLILALFCVHFMPMFVPGIKGLNFGILLLGLFLITFILSFPAIILALTPPIILFERCSPLSAFVRAIHLTWEYGFHVLSFIILQILSGLFIIPISFILAEILKNFFLLEPNILTFYIAGVLYIVSTPFFINLRTYYFQDLMLRQQGYNSLLYTRQKCNCASFYRERPQKQLRKYPDLFPNNTLVNNSRTL